jgi:hypothetical protein
MAPDPTSLFASWTPSAPAVWINTCERNCDVPILGRKLDDFFVRDPWLVGQLLIDSKYDEGNLPRAVIGSEAVTVSGSSRIAKIFLCGGVYGILSNGLLDGRGHRWLEAN